MATTVVSTIGTAGDYSTLASWEAASPADLVAADQIWQGQVKNEEFVGASTMLTIAGQTTDATRYVELTTESGASFADNANKLTNALRYNAANGAGIRTTGGYATAAVVVSTNFTRLSKLQISGIGSQTAGISNTGNSCVVDQCIIVGDFFGITSGGNSVTVLNTLAITDAPSRLGATAIRTVAASMSCYNCTAVGYSDVVPSATSAAFYASYGAMLLKNCAGFGHNLFGRVAGGPGFSGSSSNNASDKTISFGTANQPSLTYADQFENTASGTADFRTKTGATLIANGVDLTASGVTVDIVGSARADPFDIGAWQVAGPTPPTPSITGGGGIVTMPPDFGYPQSVTRGPPNPAMSV